MEWGGIKTLEIILYNKCFICLRQQYILFSKCREKGEILKHWEIIKKKNPPFFSKQRDLSVLGSILFSNFTNTMY